MPLCLNMVCLKGLMPLIPPEDVKIILRHKIYKQRQQELEQSFLHIGKFYFEVLNRKINSKTWFINTVDQKFIRPICLMRFKVEISTS